MSGAQSCCSVTGGQPLLWDYRKCMWSQRLLMSNCWTRIQKCLGTLLKPFLSHFGVHPSTRLDTEMKHLAQSHSCISGSLFIKLNIHLLFILPVCVHSSGVFYISEKVFNVANLSETKYFNCPILKLFLFFFAFVYSSFPHLPFKRFCHWDMDWIKWYKSWNEVPLDRWNRGLLYKLGQRLPIRTSGFICTQWPGKKQSLIVH